MHPMPTNTIPTKYREHSPGQAMITDCEAQESPPDSLDRKVATETHGPALVYCGTNGPALADCGSNGPALADCGANLPLTRTSRRRPNPRARKNKKKPDQTGPESGEDPVPCPAGENPVPHLSQIYDNKYCPESEQDPATSSLAT